MAVPGMASQTQPASAHGADSVADRAGDHPGGSGLSLMLCGVMLDAYWRCKQVTVFAHLVAGVGPGASIALWNLPG